jgi:hypothetical protein
MNLVLILLFYVPPLPTEKCGYLPLSLCPSHRVLWFAFVFLTNTLAKWRTEFVEMSLKRRLDQG